MQTLASFYRWSILIVARSQYMFCCRSHHPWQTLKRQSGWSTLHSGLTLTTQIIMDRRERKMKKQNTIENKNKQSPETTSSSWLVFWSHSPLDQVAFTFKREARNHIQPLMDHTWFGSSFAFFFSLPIFSWLSTELN